MSTQYSYVGPYVQCTYRKEQAEVEAFGCMNPQCAEYQLEHGGGWVGKFCPACGKPQGATKKLIPYRSPPQSIVGDALQDVGSMDEEGDFLYLAPNLRHSLPPKGLARDGTLHLDLGVVHPTADMARFEETYVTELEALRGAYDNVQVKWGVHQYFR